MVIYVCHVGNTSRALRPSVASGAERDMAEVPPWLADPQQALALAKTANKDVLIEFDGPGSATEPDAFHAAVSDTREFRGGAGRKFVLVRLSSSADVSPERATQIATWCERLGVIQFPTLALLDAQNRPYASAVCQSKDSGEALRLLDSLAHKKVERDDELARAKGVAGVERARHLDAALQAVGSFAGEAYIDVMREILVLDSNNSAGLHAKYQTTVAEVTINQAVQGEVYPLIDRGNLTGAVQRLDRLIAETDASPQQRQLLLAFKGQLYFSLHDNLNAARSFDDALRIAPDSDAAAKVRAARAQVLGS